MSTPQRTNTDAPGPESIDGVGEDRTSDMQDFDEDSKASSIQPGHENPHALSLVGHMFNDPTDSSSTADTKDNRTRPQPSSAPDSEGLEAKDQIGQPTVKQGEDEAAHEAALKEASQNKP